MRVYSVSAKTASFTAAKTLVLLRNVATQCVKLLSAHVVASDNDTNEQLDIGFGEVTAIGSAAGATLVVAKHQHGDPATALTLTNSFELTVEPTTYTDSIARMGASSLGGYHYTPTLAEALTIAPSEIWGLRLLTAMDSSKALTIFITYGEIG